MNFFHSPSVSRHGYGLLGRSRASRNHMIIESLSRGVYEGFILQGGIYHLVERHLISGGLNHVCHPGGIPAGSGQTPAT